MDGTLDLSTPKCFRHLPHIKKDIELLFREVGVLAGDFSDNLARFGIIAHTVP